MADLPVVNGCVPLAGSPFSKRQAAQLEVVMKSLADRHRLQILHMLLRTEGKAICVCEFEPVLDLSQGTVSHHLKVLVEAGLIEREGRGTRSYFSLVPGVLDSLREVFVPARALMI
jgi:ArsR family transcriptional regulator, arsenate/arsenite/antimonite-responsive transcriptional repressor